MRLAVIVFFLLLLATQVGATTIARFTYKIGSSDGRFVFVMRAPYPELEDAFAPSYIASGVLLNDHDARTRAIREKYSQSGLYRNDGSSLPLWAVDWYSQEVAVSNDGIHLIRFSRDGIEELSEEAFAFFEDGREIRKYRVGDLVDSTSGFKLGLTAYQWLDTVILDDESATLSVALISDDRFSFDIRTGDLLRVERNRRKLVIAFWVGAAVLVLIIGLILVVRRY